MTKKMKVETAGKVRKISPARVNSKARGRPIADLVERFEGTGSAKTLSSAALRAGDLIRTMRKAAGMSQLELARKIDVSQARISEIEAGLGSQGPTWDVMERIATAFGKRWQIADKRLTAEAVRPAEYDPRTGKNVRLPAKYDLLAAGRLGPLKLHREVDPLFLDASARWWRGPASFLYQGGEPPSSVPAVNIAETEQAYEITAELPNTDAEDIEVRFGDGILSIKGEKRLEGNEEQAKEYYLAERVFGSFQRAFRVPEGIDVNNIEATFNNGVLTVKLPKPAGVQRAGKRIAVTTSNLGKEANP
jgi:HSP20 family protein